MAGLHEKKHLRAPQSFVYLCVCVCMRGGGGGGGIVKMSTTMAKDNTMNQP